MRIRNWTGLFCGLIYFVTVGLGEANPYYNKRFNFFLDLPEQYKVEELENPSRTAMVATGPDDVVVNVVVTDNPFAGDLIEVDKETKMRTGFDLVRRLGYFNRESGFPNAVIAERDGMQFYRIRWSYFAMEKRNDYLDLVTYQYPLGDKLYTLTLAAWRPDFPKYESELEKIISSFKRVDPGATNLSSESDKGGSPE